MQAFSTYEISHLEGENFYKETNTLCGSPPALSSRSCCSLKEPSQPRLHPHSSGTTFRLLPGRVLHNAPWLQRQGDCSARSSRAGSSQHLSVPYLVPCHVPKVVQLVNSCSRLHRGELPTAVPVVRAQLCPCPVLSASSQALCLPSTMPHGYSRPRTRWPFASTTVLLPMTAKGALSWNKRHR